MERGGGAGAGCGVRSREEESCEDLPEQEDGVDEEPSVQYHVLSI